MSELISVEEHNRRKQEARKQACKTGIACPDCGTELFLPEQGSLMLMSDPPKMDLVCGKCIRIVTVEA